MGKMKWIGGIIFLILVFGGYTFYKDSSKKAHIKTEAEAITHLLSLIEEDTTVNLNQATGGPVLHPWKFAMDTMPLQVDLEEKVKLPRTQEDKTFTWKIHGDLKGGTDLQLLTISATYDHNGNLQTLKGLHGTVQRSSASWQPD